MTDFPLTDDVVLLNSGDTARKGMYVEFGLFHHPDGPILPGMSNPFNELSQGREKGQRFRITITPLAEDETTPAEPQDARDAPEGTGTPATPETRTQPQKERRPWHELSAREQSVLRCKDEAFQRWVNMRFGPVGTDFNEENAALMVRTLCQVSTRGDLDECASAAWHAIDNEFRRSQRGQSDEEVAKQARRG